MEKLTCRLLPYAVADGAHNMALDETLLISAVSGVATLRFYGWSTPTVSLGYFQSERQRYKEPGAAALPFVRRPTGGALLVHHHELTYALAIPVGSSWHDDSWPHRVHRLFVAALADLGVPSSLFEASEPETLVGPLCFRHFAAGDVVIGRVKIVGCAQRKHHGAILQHGAVLLARSPHTPSLQGIADVTGRQIKSEQLMAGILDQWNRVTQIDLQTGTLTSAEEKTLQQLAERKYFGEAWNGKR